MQAFVPVPVCVCWQVIKPKLVCTKIWIIFAQQFDACMNNSLVESLHKLLDHRDSVQAVMKFAKRNRLPPKLQEQMLAHMRLKFKSESLEQYETVASLPKALRANISHHLFLSTVQQVYLFQGTSYNFLCQLVSVESPRL